MNLSQNQRFADNHTVILPLPPGEGWGEGKGEGNSFAPALTPALLRVQRTRERVSSGCHDGIDQAILRQVHDFVRSSKDRELSSAIRDKMQPCGVVMVLAGVYASYGKWIDKEIKIAQSGFSKPKPILATALFRLSKTMLTELLDGTPIALSVQ